MHKATSDNMTGLSRYTRTFASTDTSWPCAPCLPARDSGPNSAIFVLVVLSRKLLCQPLQSSTNRPAPVAALAHLQHVYTKMPCRQHSPYLRYRYS
jgi:hypothetical protein